MHYSIGIELYDYEGSKPLNILKYSTLNDLVGKHLKLVIDLRKAQDIPEKLSYEVECKYHWLDQDKTEYPTQVVKSGGQSGVPLSRAPQFNYHKEHMIEIDEELISNMIESTLKFGVYGKIEQKKKTGSPTNAESPEKYDFTNATKYEMESSPKKGGMMSADELERLRKENAELMEQIKRYKEGKQNVETVKQVGCTTCNIF